LVRNRELDICQQGDVDNRSVVRLIDKCLELGGDRQFDLIKGVIGTAGIHGHYRSWRQSSLERPYLHCAD
jgi:hypothetical protein